MTKYFCDCCHKETKYSNLNEFKYLCHLNDLYSGSGFVDSEMNRTSQKYVTVDLCNKCYNEVVYKAVDAFIKKSVIPF